MARARRFTHTPAKSKVAVKMRGMTPTMAKAYKKAAGKPRAARPKSVPVKVITRTAKPKLAKPRATARRPSASHSRAYHAGKAVGEALGSFLTKEHS